MKRKFKYFKKKSRPSFFGSKIRTLFLIAALGLCLSACGDKETSATSPGEKEENSQKSTGKPSGVSSSLSPSATTPPTPTPAPVYHAVIYDNLSKGTRVELDLFEGQTLDLNSFTQLLGYDFIGCYDKQSDGGEQYIDISGKVCTELVSDLVLYAWYEPKNYTLSFTCNGESGSQYGIVSKFL